MTSLTQNRMTVAIAILLPGAASLWLLTRSGTVPTGVGLAALVIATALIGLNTWKNAQPTGSVGQLIHEIKVATVATSNPRPALDRPNTSRWDAWRMREEALAHTGRVRAWLALSVAATAALLYAWLA
jgi:hypothetical protein